MSLSSFSSKEQTKNISCDALEYGDRIRQLNDQLRTTGYGGMVQMSEGVAAYSVDTVKGFLAAIADFSAFNAENDPWGERDRGIVLVDEVAISWRINCYDRSRTTRSPDAANPKVTTRVLTIMLAGEC